MGPKGFELRAHVMGVPQTRGQGFYPEKGIAKCNGKPGSESQTPALWSLGSGPNPISEDPPEAMAITRCLVPSEKLSSFFVIKMLCIYYLLDIVLLQVSVWRKKGVSNFNFFKDPLEIYKLLWNTLEG